MEGLDVFDEGVEGHCGDVSRGICANEGGEDFDDSRRDEGGGVGDLVDAGFVVDKGLDVVVEFSALVGRELVDCGSRCFGSVFADFVFESVEDGPEVFGRHGCVGAECLPTENGFPEEVRLGCG